ncbi:unnamed protein product [Dibothriocephalus latus]|uniref:Uncharacterized protein n=1 Tax=Dibothriocephalus latus TaxID=60516 RepID=A0A3P7N7M0_DIBLA|nr:unnamed protein product [Dibothriocephalus latus]
MARALIVASHQRLRKYKVVIEQKKSECAGILGDSITEDLAETIAALAQLRQARKRVILDRKLNKLRPPDTGSSNLVHNLSSKQLTERQQRVVQHEACFNTADADPVDFIVAVEAILVRTETTDENKTLSENGSPSC